MDTDQAVYIFLDLEQIPEDIHILVVHTFSRKVDQWAIHRYVHTMNCTPQSARLDHRSVLGQQVDIDYEEYTFLGNERSPDDIDTSVGHTSKCRAGQAAIHKLAHTLNCTLRTPHLDHRLDLQMGIVLGGYICLDHERIPVDIRILAVHIQVGMVGWVSIGK